MHFRSLCRALTIPLLLGTLLPLPRVASAHARQPATTPLVVVLDPGHGGTMHYGNESGAVDPTGSMLEKNMSLAVAKLAAKDLQAMGYQVYLTRTSDQPVNTPPRDWNHDGKVDRIDEYEARTLFANRHHADIFVSIHFDGASDPSVHGTHGYYCPARPFWRNSQRLSNLLTTSVATTVTKAGYADLNKGVQTDVADVVPQTRADYPWFLVLGPSRHHWITGTTMPGALIETMFLSSPRDSTALRRSSIVAAVARGYASGIQAYFGGKTHR